MPTLFVVGDRDVGAPPEIVAILAGLVPGAALAVMPSAGHSAHLENAKAFNAVLLDFPARVDDWT
jgi:pimeloyl-ACP methyl ester carboxylesterase